MPVRVAEVAARFTLDAMPGKQMAIDADLNAGLIDEDEARKRREEISRQADFYGAMDGSSKFVKGDAVAGLLITAINVIGGIFIGVIQRGMPIGQAASTYTMLTIGDGLVSQIPALIVSTASGIMVTNAGGSTRMGSTFATQLGAQSRSRCGSRPACSATFGLIPGLPFLPFMALGVGLGRTSARSAGKGEKLRAQIAAAADYRGDSRHPEEESPMRDLLQIDPIELEVGYALIPLVDERPGRRPPRAHLAAAQAGRARARASWSRRSASATTSACRPTSTSSSCAAPRSPAPRSCRASSWRSIPAASSARSRASRRSIPASACQRAGSPAHRRVEAESFGYVVVEPPTVIATHLMEMLKASAGDLLGRQDVQEMVDALKKTHPALVDDVIPGKVSLGVLHRVLQRLLKERLPIRDLVSILEALGDAADHTKDPGGPHGAGAARPLARHRPAAPGRGPAASARSHGAAARGRSDVTLQPARWSASSGIMNPDTLAGLLRELSAISMPHSLDGRIDPAGNASRAAHRRPPADRAGAAAASGDLAGRAACAYRAGERGGVGDGGVGRDWELGIWGLGIWGLGIGDCGISGISGIRGFRGFRGFSGISGFRDCGISGFRDFGISGFPGFRSRIPPRTALSNEPCETQGSSPRRSGPELHPKIEDQDCFAAWSSSAVRWGPLWGRGPPTFRLPVCSHCQAESRHHSRNLCLSVAVPAQELVRWPVKVHLRRSDPLIT